MARIIKNKTLSVSERGNMVNQNVLEYLRTYGKSFSLDDLRRKIIAGGYSEEDFNEAAVSLGLIKPEVKISAMPDFFQKSGGVRWMRFAGIIGIVFLVLSAVFFMASFFISSYFSSGSIFLAIVVLFIALIAFVSYLFFLKGFARVGSYTSGLLRFSSITLIILSIVAAVLIIAAVILVYLWIIRITGGITGAAVSSLDYLGAVPSFSSFGAAGWGIFVTLVLIAIFFIVINTLFFSGLIASRAIKFARIGGILGIVLTAVSIISGLYIFSNPFVIFGLLVSETARYALLVMQILIYILSWIVLLFETLALFDASRKFEGEGY